MRSVRILLVIVAVVCFGVALSYPVRYYLAQKSNNDNMEQLSSMRSRVMEEEADEPGMPSRPEPEQPDAGEAEAPEAEVEPDDAGADAPAPEAPEEVSGEAPEAEPVPDGNDAPAVEVGDSPEAEASEGRTARSGEAETDAIPDARETAVEAQTDAGDAEEDVAPGVPKREDFAGESVGEPADEPAGEPADEPAGEPANEPVGEPVDEPAGEPANEPAGEVADADAPPAANAAAGEAGGEALPEATPEPTPEPSPEPSDWWDLTLYEFLRPTPTPQPRAMHTPTPVPAPTPLPTPTRDRTVYTGALPYSMKDKVVFDEDAMLPELKEIYALNHDLVGWITIPDTVIDYPVVQTQDSEFYLTHDFYGEENVNGQIILDAPCDPYTPSYNLIISGHHMKNGSMFGDLPEYRTKNYWEKHKFVEFDTLMAKKQYVVFAAFYSADYDEDEEGFRYNANIEYKMDAKQWLAEVEANQLYDTGIDAEFGDEFITLTTCNRARHRNGRFVVVCRKIREGETFE